MARDNSFDSIADKVGARVSGAKAKIHSKFKNTNQFRQTPMTNKERLLAFAQTDPKVIQAWLNTKDPQVRTQVNDYILRMQELGRKEGANGNT
ncbi:hypothetical protein LCGC14_2099200 [marine sediment metagenome]|uniref:Uncharacterized protein n=1 Tax=marine sediment metagenome TaxID=412755 RepID=A0A0F9EAN8_9ZZZZ